MRTIGIFLSPPTTLPGVEPGSTACQPASLTTTPRCLDIEGAQKNKVKKIMSDFMWPHRYAKNVKKPLGLSRVLEIYDRFLLSLGTPDITFEHPIQNGAPENLAS